MNLRNLHIVIALFLLVLPKTVDAALISEFEPNPAGFDSELQFVEFSGVMGSSFSGVLLGIGGETGRIGRIDYAANVSGVFDANGLLTAQVGDLFAPTLTVVLAESFSGIVGQSDIDLDDDGVADNLSIVGGIHDAIGIPDNLAGESFLYGSQLGGQNFGFTGDEPELVFRDASVGQWYAINDVNGSDVFGIDGQKIANQGAFNRNPFQPSFGQTNPSITAIPEPSLTLITSLSLSYFCLGIRRRKRN
ncbi:hypothetical protein [Stieleria sp.]|uniref:hypothetical protein n=1 Tax=Stieleria sp. TaxID=2795976 RepID=UPI00356174B5